MPMPGRYTSGAPGCDPRPTKSDLKNMNEAPQETCTGTVRQPAGEDAGPAGKGFWLHSVMGRRGDALRLVRADTAALRKFIRVNPG